MKPRAPVRLSIRRSGTATLRQTSRHVVPHSAGQQNRAPATGDDNQRDIPGRGTSPAQGASKKSEAQTPRRLPQKVLAVRKIPPFWRRVDDNAPVTPEKLRVWRLVCSALRIPYRQIGSGLVVPVLYEQVARNHFTAVAAEGRRIPPPTPIVRKNIPQALLLLGLLLVWFQITRSWGAASEWNSAGALYVWDTLHNGQWYRVFTALTLHGDGQHLFNNLAFGAPFFVLLCRRAGLGPAALLTVLAGGLGNVGNVVYRLLSNATGHVSLGFSTALFGIVGALTGLMAMAEILHAVRIRRLARQAQLSPNTDPHVESHTGPGLRRAFVFMAVGVAVLALLGSDPSATTDYAAHVCGLAAGLLCGAGYGLVQQQMTRRLEWLAGGIAAGILVASWGVGLRAIQP